MAIQNLTLNATSPGQILVSSGYKAVTAIIFCNNSLTTDATVTVWLVPSGYAVGNNNMILNTISVPRGETFSIDTEKFILSNGDSVQAQASQNSIITATISFVSLS
jgi:hypothetical protein